jgi:hypothetical protein
MKRLGSSRQNRYVSSLLRDFGCSSEEELHRKLIRESSTIPCTCCGREIPIEKVRSYQCNPYCANCIN